MTRPMVSKPLNVLSKAKGRALHRPCGKEFGAAKQEFIEETDINRIMAKYRLEGVLSHAFGPADDVIREDVGYKGYEEMHDALERAKAHFLKLPPEVRLELGNNPGRYREVSTPEGMRAVLQRIGKRERNRLAAAQALVRKHAPKPPSQPDPEHVEEAPKPPGPKPAKGE